MYSFIYVYNLRGLVNTDNVRRSSRIRKNMSHIYNVLKTEEKRKHKTTKTKTDENRIYSIPTIKLVSQLEYNRMNK